MTMVPMDEDILAKLDVETEIQRVDSSAVAVLNRSEVEAQLDAAHKYPRHIGRFMKEAMGMACLTREVAESCMYTLPRGGKPIVGPSVRLAEICASAYGNLHFGARVLDVEEKEVVAQGVAWDLERNIRVSIEARRRITGKDGRRYNDDMIGVTGAAAGSIALRNALFRVIPRAYVDVIYAKAKEVAVGNAQTLVARRAEVVSRLNKMGVPVERVFARVERKGIDDITLEDLEVLIGLGTAIHAKDRTIDEAFPPIDQTQSKTKALETELLGGKVKHDADGVVVEPTPAKRTTKPKAEAKPQATHPPATTPDVRTETTASGVNTFKGFGSTPETPANDEGRDDEGAEAALGQQEGREPGSDDQ